MSVHMDVVEAAPTFGTIRTARIWALHLLCFVLPVASFAFLVTAPHSWSASLPWLLVVIGSIAADTPRKLTAATVSKASTQRASLR